MKKLLSLLLTFTFVISCLSNPNISLVNATNESPWEYNFMGEIDYAKKLASSEAAKNEVVVAVLDSGIKADDEIFKKRLILKEDYNLTDEKDTPTVAEFHHGQYVAGTIVDCTPGLDNIKILPVKVSGVSENVDDNIACWVDGVEYAVKNGADIINMSLGGLEEFTTDESYQSY
nr:S8 family serine peptidase [Lachnospiraceae bacterium]